jgi:tetrahydromethanopterin S-methyltransferase subunit G
LLYSLKLLIFAKSLRVMERITIELPIVKVRIEDPWCGCDYGKEHYEEGLFVIDDGISRYLGMWDGLSLWHCPMPHGLIDKYIVERAISDNDEVYHRDMEAIEERLDRIEKLCSDTNGEMYKQKESRVKGFKALSERFDSIEDKFSEVSKGSEGVNILDVARSFAIIQNPELIKELNK